MTRVQNIFIFLLILMTVALIPARSFSQVPTTLTAEFGPPAEANTWQKFTIPLTNDAFGTDAKTFQFVLSNVQQFRIRTEMYTGADVGAIDSVKIGGRFTSTFDVNNEGWNAAGDGTMEWIGDGGVTGGFLQISDWASGDWHWAVAPASWSGDWKDLIGSNIVFYLKTDHPAESSVVEISSVGMQRLILSATPQTIPAGGTGTLRINLNPAPSTNLTVNLDSGDTGCITLPAEVTVPAGSSFVDVTMTTAPGAALCSSVITATATDYTTSRITVNVGERNPADYGTLHGRVTDATTGEGIAGATVKVGGFETVTDADGAYQIENIYTGKIAANFYGTPRNGYAPLAVHFTDLSRAGYHLVQASVDGFYDYETFVIIPGGDATTLDISLSPIIETGSLRLVLNWGETPQDLDLYLDTPVINGNEYIVSWFSKGSALTAPYAVLDHDDVDGLGPETITIHDLYDGTYKCFVHNFSVDPAITTSNGVVQIYGPEGLLHTVYVPESGDGLYWYVCDIDGATGEVTIVNTIVNEAPGASFVASALAKHKKPKSSRIEAFTELLDVSSWQWDFNNDGVIDATDENPVYTYNLPGTYTVSLTVSDGVNSYKETKENYITVLTTDTTPPGPVSSLFADIVGATSAQLTWTNPGDADYAGTIIMRRTDRYPTSTSDGLKVYEGIGRSFTDDGLSPGTTYYYTAFAYDNLMQVSEIGETSRASVTIKPPYKGGLIVNVSNVDATGFPQIKAFTSVVDSIEFTPVTGLTRTNFAITEDGHTESPITVEELTGSSDARADIAFVFDVTGSMGSQITGLKQRALNFADALAAKGVDYRLALVTYGDNIREVHDFTSSADEFKGWVEGLVADGGGDTKENSLEGLARATTLSFRAVTQKMTILITDADYHEAGESGDGTTTYTTDSMVELLKSKNIINNVVGPDYVQMHQLAEGTGGLYFNITRDFQTIIDLMGSIISSQYIITYTTHNTSVNNTWRLVQVHVDSVDKAGSGLGRYYIGEGISNVHQLRAYAISSTQIMCRWWNPDDSTFSGTVVVRSNKGYPTTPTDGTVIYSGFGHSVLDSGLNPSTVYYYSAFAYNWGGQYAESTEEARDATKTFAKSEFTSGWVRLTSGTNVNLRSVFAVDSAYVYAVGDSGVVLRSSNGGETWEKKVINKGSQFRDVLFMDRTSGGAGGIDSDGNAQVVATRDRFDSWDIEASGSTTPLNAIDAGGVSNVWIVGDAGKIERMGASTEGTWVPQTSGTSENLYAVSFVDPQNGWVSGANGVILRTSDGGTTWTAQASRVSSDIYGIHFQDLQNGWAVTSDGKILRTVNGGNTWSNQSVYTGFLKSIHFSDPLHGYAVGKAGAVFATEDGGASWTKIETKISADLYSVYVITPYIGWAVGENGTILRLVQEGDFAALTGYKMTISSIDVESFPLIKCFTSVVDAESHASVTGLTADNFRAFEDGTEESPIKVEEMSTSSGARADIVFVFDVTGSMGEEINGLKERALRFADALAAKGIDYRLGLVTFGDEVEEVHDFTTDATEFKAWIDGLRASGGGDTKENALEGLARATKLSFRAVTQRIAILITDADYHEAGETGGGTTTYTTESIIELLDENRIVTNVVGPDLTQYHQMSENTGGLFFNITGDFQAIVDNIGSLIASQYVISYTTHDQIPNNAWRNVTITAEKASKGGYDRSKYFIGSSRMYMTPQNIVGILDNNFTVDVNIQSVLNLGLCHFFVNFDASKVQVVDVVKGDFLDQDGASSTSIKEVDNTNGKVELSLTRVGTTTGASGSGLLYKITFHVIAENCAGTLAFTSVDLRQPDNKAITVTTQGATIQAAAVSGLLGDFDKDLDIDTHDFSLLATYWKPTNTKTGDIGPATGTVPALTPAPDGVVNFEDLFVFTRMWNWYHQIHAGEGGGALAKSNTRLEWRLADQQTNAKTIRMELWADGIDHLAMGHIQVEFDQRALQFKSASAGQLLSRGDASTAFFADAGKGAIDISMSRLAPKGQSPEVNGSGVLAVFEFEKKNNSAQPLVNVAELDFRSADNAEITIDSRPDFSLDSGETPTAFSLSQNYPNPFNSSTQMQFNVPQSSLVQITVMNVLGQPVRTLVNARLEAGSHRVVWNGKNEFGQEVAGGIYLVRMKAGSFQQTREMVYLK